MDFVHLNGLDSVPPTLRGCAVAIGNFDGFHRGHQHVFARLRTRARDRGAPAVVVTFEPHPRDVFAPQPVMFRLTQGDAKARLARSLGLDGIVVLPFTREFSQLEAEDFVQRFLVDALGVSSVVVGADFHFGRQRRGTPDFMRDAGRRHGFAVEILEMLDEGDDHISSSRIRAALAGSELGHANQLLGYHWFLRGEVIPGDRRGRELGFPTANIATPEVFGLAQGVYAVKVLVRGEVRDGVASYGKPMFNNQRPPFETYLFDFDADIYGETIEIALVEHLRGQQVYTSLDELIAAIARDSANARKALAAAQPISELDRQLGFVA